MYNRYIAREDGTFQKQHLPEPALPLPIPTSTGQGGFISQLLPEHLDTGDLLVIAMLLLMGGDQKDSRSLLTILLYLFL